MSYQPICFGPMSKRLPKVVVEGGRGGLTIAQKRRSQSSCDDIQDDSQRYQEDRCVDIHSGQRRQDRATSKKQLRADEDIGDQREEQEHAMSEFSIAIKNDLQKRVAPRSIHLRLAGQDGEDEDLDGGSRRIPERTGDAICVGHSRALQESCGPS